MPNDKTITYSRVVSLSHAITPDIPLWPGDPPVEFHPVAEIPRDGFYLRRFSMGEHSATHMNAPNSFHPDGAGIDAYPAEALVAPAVVINICDRTAANPDYALIWEDVLAWEKRHSQIARGSVVLLYTGWQGKWEDPDAFLNRDASGNLHFPGFSGDTTQLLLDKRRIAGLGTDAHGVDPGRDKTFAVSARVLEQPRIVLENLTNLDQLPPTGTTLVIGILRLRGGSGSPVAVTAFVP